MQRPRRVFVLRFLLGLYLVKIPPRNTRYSGQKPREKNLQISQTFFIKIVDIYQEVWYYL